MMKKLACTASVALSISALPVTAVPLELHDASKLMEYASRSGVDNQELRGVLDSLNKGERQQAKQRLAAYIKRFPNDARGVEIAGMILLEEKNLQAAALSFRRAMDLNPGSTSAKAKLGATALLQGRMQDGERILREVIAANPQELLAHRYLAWVEEERDQPAAAARHLEAMLAAPGQATKTLTEMHVALARNYNRLGRSADTVRLLTPLVSSTAGVTVVPASLLLSQAQADLHKPAAAAKALEPARKHLKPNDPQLLLANASIDLAKHSYEPARRQLEQAIKAQPALERVARDRIAASYMDERKPDLAAAEYEKIAAIVDPKALPGVLANYMTAKFAAGKGKEAADTVSSWAAKHPEVPGLGLLRVDALAAAGDRNGAVVAAKQLVARNADFVPAYLSLGNLQRGLGQRKDAEAQLRRATEIAPSLAETWVGLAGVHADAGDWTKAETVLQQGLKGNPGQPMLQAELATVYELSGRGPQAAELYRGLVSRFPENLVVLTRAAVSLAGYPETRDEARRFAEAAVKVADGHPAASDAIGWVLVQSGDTGKGVPFLEAAHKAAPRDGLFAYHLGAAYMKAGRTTEGRKLLERSKALGLRPDLEQTLAQLLS
jgi:tetratricopeptide (TPR) repeat protein